MARYLLIQSDGRVNYLFDGGMWSFSNNPCLLVSEYVALLFKERVSSSYVLFADEHNCPHSSTSNDSSSLLHLVSPPLIISAAMFSLTILLATIHAVRTYLKKRAFHTAVQQTLDNDSPTNESDEKTDPPPYTTVLRLGRSYQYCDV